MKILHVCKTSHGADWAIWMASEHTLKGHEIHVILPDNKGRSYKEWKRIGATIHLLNLSISNLFSLNLFDLIKKFKNLTRKINPDLIHVHFLSNIIFLRIIDRYPRCPRIFQIPGPLHLENPIIKFFEIFTSGPSDYWIASSKYTQKKYLDSNLNKSKIFLSYYGSFGSNTFFDRIPKKNLPTNILRKKFNIPESEFIIGNFNYVYPPKYLLGQLHGIKRHKEIIKSLKSIINEYSITCLFIGGQWGKKLNYLNKLKKLAQKIHPQKIKFINQINPSEVLDYWNDFNLAIHIPSSENCGGVIEPLLSEVPVLACKTGGLPEVIINGYTGALVEHIDTESIAQKILEIKENYPYFKKLACNGKKLVLDMFSFHRTAEEILAIYLHIINPESHSRPNDYETTIELNDVKSDQYCPAAPGQIF